MIIFPGLIAILLSSSSPSQPSPPLDFLHVDLFGVDSAQCCCIAVHAMTVDDS
jgi:hypothetical protein